MNEKEIPSVANVHRKFQGLKPKGETKRSFLVLHPTSDEDTVNIVRTFALIVSAHPYCTRKFTQRHGCARALGIKMNNDREVGHCYSFAWV